MGGAVCAAVSNTGGFGTCVQTGTDCCCASEALPSTLSALRPFSCLLILHLILEPDLIELESRSKGRRAFLSLYALILLILGDPYTSLRTVSGALILESRNYKSLGFIHRLKNLLAQAQLHHLLPLPQVNPQYYPTKYLT